MPQQATKRQRTRPEASSAAAAAAAAANTKINRYYVESLSDFEDESTSDYYSLVDSIQDIQPIPTSHTGKSKERSRSRNEDGAANGNQSITATQSSRDGGSSKAKTEQTRGLTMADFETSNSINDHVIINKNTQARPRKIKRISEPIAGPSSSFGSEPKGEQRKSRSRAQPSTSTSEAATKKGSARERQGSTAPNSNKDGTVPKLDPVYNEKQLFLSPKEFITVPVTDVMVFERSRRKRMVDIQQLPNSGPFHVTAKVDLEHIVNLTVKEELKRNNKKFAQLQFLAEAFYFEYPGADEPGFVWLESPIVWYKISAVNKEYSATYRDLHDKVTLANSVFSYTFNSKEYKHTWAEVLRALANRVQQDTNWLIRRIWRYAEFLLEEWRKQVQEVQRNDTINHLGRIRFFQDLEIMIQKYPPTTGGDPLYFLSSEFLPDNYTPEGKRKSTNERKKESTEYIQPIIDSSSSEDEDILPQIRPPGERWVTFMTPSLTTLTDGIFKCPYCAKVMTYALTDLNIESFADEIVMDHLDDHIEELCSLTETMMPDKKQLKQLVSQSKHFAPISCA